MSGAAPRFERRLVLGLAAAALLVHLVVALATPYEVHRDELLYFAMGRHLRFWRMDFPPGIAVLAGVSRALLGETLLAVRLVPAVAGAVLVALAGRIAFELGGRRWAQGLAAGALLLNPLFMRAAALFQPVVLDQLAWTLGLWCLLRIARADDSADGAAEPREARRWWLRLGAATGAGLLVKFSIVFFGLAALAAIVLTPLRRHLRTPWPWAAALLALALGSPSLVGQLRLDFPVLGQMRDLQSTQLERVTPAAFLFEQVLYGPTTLVGLVGLAALLALPRLRPWRVLGVACLGCFVLLLALHGKGYYVGPVYPTLIAAGAVTLEGCRRRGLGAALRRGTVAAAVAYGLLVLPLGLPILPPPAMARYAAALGITAATRTNQGEVLPLPQDYADMLGWESKARMAARVIGALPPAQRAQAVLLGANYGQAGALEFYGRRYGLPPVVSPAGSWWHFGPGTRPGAVLVTVGVPRVELERAYGSVRGAGVWDDPWAVPEERRVEFLVATEPRATLQAIWPSLAGLH